MRINLIHPEYMADQHLFAEWRELKMAPQMLRRSLQTLTKESILARVGDTYTLNKGHGLFIYDKMNFLADRYVALTAELEHRDYNLAERNLHEVFFEGIPAEFRTINWSPSKADMKVNIDRVEIRLNERPTWYRYYGKVVKPTLFEDLYSVQLTKDTGQNTTDERRMIATIFNQFHADEDTTCYQQ